ncbi:transmembrane protein 128-like [Ptychodera flava]|uniref:transmembrane protein 128-like n=1 Tax=Ptychodera flava TaxID=63121 RepID=UPI00396A63C0
MADAYIGPETRSRARKRILAEHFLKVYGKDLKDFDKEGEEQLRKVEESQKWTPYTLSNAMWMVASIAVFYYTDFAIAVRVDPRINRLWFNVGVVLVAVNIAIGFYFVVICSWIRKIHTDDWEKHMPAAIPIATVAFIGGAVCLNVGLWPVWSILTPFILFTLFMGVVVLISLLPNF